MTSARLVGLLVSVSVFFGCAAAEPPPPAPHQNPLYDENGNAGTNPLFESTHLVLDGSGRPVLVYAQKVVEKATSGLKDTLKTNVRVVRPDVAGEGVAQGVATDAAPRALGTVKGVVHLVSSEADGAALMTTIGDVATEPARLVGFGVGDFTALHQSVVNVGGTAFAALQSRAGDTNGQSVLVELGATSPRVIAVGKAVGQPGARFIADGSDDNAELGVAFEAGGTVHTALSAGGALSAAIDTGKAGAPLAVWTDGKRLKTVVDARDGRLVFLEGVRASELTVDSSALCRAVAFSKDGVPYVLEVKQTEAKLLDAAGTVLATETTTFVVGDFVDCALVVDAQLAHLAWRTLRSPPTESRIVLDEIDYVSEPLDGSAALKPRPRTRHDTTKNSISNVR